jgi:mRNA interferase RelE/StbE
METRPSSFLRRVGDYRVVFRVDAEEILILGIYHRKEVYQLMERRQ